MSSLFLKKFKPLSFAILLALSTLTGCKVDENGKMANNYPIAAAGEDQVVISGASVMLDGKASTDSDGQIMLYAWQQVDGPPATLPYNPAPQLTFTAPDTDHDIALTFRLTVVDDVGFKGTDLVVVQVKAKPNQLPSASAGLDQAVSAATAVTLNASASQDKDGQIISYSWQQISGTPVTLTHDQTMQASFTAPEVKVAETLVFEVVVKDNRGATATDQVAVQVKPELLLVGQFISSTGGVAGLNYSTATQVGQTNTKGEFNYKTGETVTFKIGEFILGSAVGATNVSSFDLLNIKPPVTAPETSAELRLQARMEKPTQFEVANNMATFLQTLDEDSNLTNGITIPEAIKPLIKASTLDFSMNPSDKFADNAQFKYLLRQSRAAGIWEGKKAIQHYAKALDSLYAGLGMLPIIPKLVSKISSDNLYDNSTYSFERNKWIREFVLTNGNVRRSIRVFDELGKVLTEETQLKTLDSNPQIVVLETIKYTSNGQLEERNRKNYLLDGTLNRELIDSYLYDDVGNTFKNHLQDGMLNISSIHAYLYDSEGNIIEDKVKELDVIKAQTGYRYNANKLASYTAEYFDRVGLSQLTCSIGYVFFTESNKSVEVYGKDLDFNGVFDSQTTTTYSFDNRGNWTEQLVESDTNLDGVRDTYEKTTRNFDSQGAITSRITKKYAKEALQSSSIYSVSQEGSSIIGKSEIDHNADGVIDEVSIETKVIDSNGNVEVESVDNNYNTTLNYQTLRRYENFNTWFLNKKWGDITELLPTLSR